jgi:hypothetical protein
MVPAREINKVIDNSRKGKPLGKSAPGAIERSPLTPKPGLASWMGIAGMDQPIAFDANDEWIGHYQYVWHEAALDGTVN